MNHYSIQVHTREIPEILWKLTDTVTLLEKKEIHCWRASVNQLKNFKLSFQNLLSEHELERSKRFLSDKNRDTYIVAHGFLRFLLSRYTGIRPEEIEFMTGENGKPYLSHNNLHFNLSHSKEEIAVAFCHFIIGCDIEDINPGKDVRLIIKGFFSPEEQLRLAVSSSRYQDFLKLWTSKEAFLKATGIGILTELNQVNLASSTNTIHLNSLDRQFFQYDEYFITTGYTDANSIISLASCISMDKIKFLQISSTYLQKELTKTAY